MENTTDSRAIGTTEYEKNYWSYMKGNVFAEDKLSAGYFTNTGTYVLPAASDNKYETEINKKSVMRSISSVFSVYDGPEDIWATDCDDIAEFVAPLESIDITNIVDDFTKINVNSNKLAMLLRISNEFVADAGFDLKNYLVKRLAKNFAKAEDKGFIIGTGTNEPVGILNSSGGADVAFSVDSITFDDIYHLYFSVASDYRKNSVWLMNDATALTLRKLKDENGNYLWNSVDNTILGKPVMISEYMPDIEAGTKPIAFGDFSYYWIIKRSPVSVKTLNELFALNDQQGFLAFEFVDGKLIRTGAVKVLKINDAEEEK